MRLFKRCGCSEPTRCRHSYHYHFKLQGQRHFGTTRTANKKLAERIASTRRVAVLEGREGLRSAKPILLSEHVKAYVAHTAKTNRSSYKDQAVLDRLLASVGNRHITEISPFHIERWKRERADEERPEAVSKSSVNRELNIIRGCF